MSIYIHTYVCLYIRMFIHTYVYTYVCIYIRMYIHTYVYTYVCINIQALVKYGELQEIFPKSHYIVSQKALARYNMRDFSEAQLAFELILKQDPYR